MEKLVELNLQVARTALTEVADTTTSVLSVKDAQELMALQAALLQPSAEKAASYSRHVYDIASGTSTEVAKIAESQFADAQKKFNALVEHRQERAGWQRERGGPDEVGHLCRQQRFRVGAKAAKQAVDVAEANFQAATTQAVKATQATTRKKAA